MYLLGAFMQINLVVIGLLYIAHPDGGWHELMFLPRLRPYPVRGHSPLYFMQIIS